jgi:hypothetical protein
MKKALPPRFQDLQKSLKDLLASNGSVLSRYGAQLTVQYRFIDAILPLLTGPQCAEAVRLFREGVEDAMSYTDDVAVPTEYQEAFLLQTNLLLMDLEKQAKRHRIG